MSLYAASGLSGPALGTPSAKIAMISAGATVLVLTVGTWLMFTMACVFASDCM